MNRRRRLAATAGLVLLVLVDLALVVAALRISSRSSAVEPGAGNAASSTGAPTAPPAPEAAPPSTSASATSTATAGPAVPLQVLLSAVDGSVAWRSKAGSCPSGGATVALTTDRGTTWRIRTSPYPVLTRLLPTDGSRASAVGATTGCDMGVKTTADGGGTWPATGNLNDTLARDPKDPAKVRAPGGRTVTPCDGKPVVDLARSSNNAAQVLCADGGIHSTTDDGTTWPKTTDQPGAVALDSRMVGIAVTTTYIAGVKDGCKGVAIASLSGDKATDVACVAMDAPAPGTVAISVPSPDSGWLLVGDVTWRSSNGLKDWARVSG